LIPAIVGQLAKSCPRRYTGGIDEPRAVELVKLGFSRLGLPASVTSFNVRGWRSRSCKFVSTRDNQAIDCVPLIYSKSLSPTQEAGTLERASYKTVAGYFRWPMYLFSGRSGRQAEVLVRPDGPMISQPLENPRSALPAIASGSDYLALIDETARIGSPVRLSLVTQFFETAGHNIEAHLQGSKKGEIIVCAHLDCMAAEGFPESCCSRGCVDNASGVAGLLEIAKRLKKMHLRHTIRFIVFGGEEWGLLGSRWFVERRKKQDSLEAVKACVNLDSLGWRNPGEILISVTESKLRSNFSMIKLALSRLPPRASHTVIKPAIQAQDSWAFGEEGIPSCTVFVHNDKLYHTSSDSYPDAFSTDTFNRLLRTNIAIVTELDRVLP